MKFDGQIVYEAEVEPGTVGLCHCPARSLRFGHNRSGCGIIWVAEDGDAGKACHQFAH